MKKFVPLIVILFFCLSARADYHYASQEGSNEYPYISWETAAHLIQDAVNVTDPQDTVYIEAGDWYQHVETGVYDSVALIGMGTELTYCHNDSTDNYMFIIDYGCSIENITFIDGGPGPCIRARVFAGVLINNCRFIDSFSGVGASGYPTIITNCVFDSCARAISAYIWEGDFFISNNLVLYAYQYRAINLQVYSAIVQNNIIMNEPGEDVDGIVSGWIAGEVIIRNNVVVGGTGGIGVDAEKEHNNVVMYSGNGGVQAMTINYHDSLFNNSITDCGRALLVLDSGYFSYNNLWNNNEDPSFDRFIDPVGNISVDPMYISDTDFHLQAFSPLIDAGHPDYLDVDGSRSDIGAYGGPHGCSYVYLDLAPLIPDSITVEVEEQLITLNWRFNTEADFNRYQVFRDTVSGFTPSEFNMIAERDTSYYEDQDIEPGTAYYYRLTSVDNQGNVSDYSDEVGFIPTDILSSSGDRLPRYTVIECVYPNPFNSDVTIVYSASNLGPQPPEIKLQIFDIQGRVVKTLIDERMPMGTYRAVWDGTNDSGEPVSSGTYIARLTQWDCPGGDFPVKITLIK